MAKVANVKLGHANEFLDHKTATSAGSVTPMNKNKNFTKDFTVPGKFDYTLKNVTSNHNLGPSGKNF